jgi:transcriptional regulator GlxA family with amidase domain
LLKVFPSTKPQKLPVQAKGLWLAEWTRSWANPLCYFQDLRVEHAVHLLKTSDQTIEEIATQVGYSEGVTLRTLLRRRVGHGIREIRRGLDN